MRNKQMAENADGLVAVWDGSSRGTASMIDLGKAHGLRIFVVRTDIAGTREIPASGDKAGRWEVADERAGMLEFSSGLSKAEAERITGREIAKSFKWSIGSAE